MIQNMGMGLGEFIRTIRLQKKLSVAKLAQGVGISTATLNRLESGLGAVPDSGVLRAFAKVLETDFLYLMQLGGHIHKTDLDQQKVNAIAIVPWMTLAALEELDSDTLSKMSKETVPVLMSEKGLIAVRVPDNRWAPEFKMNDRVVLRLSKNLNDGDTVLVLEELNFPKKLQTSFEPVFKKIIQVQDLTVLIGIPMDCSPKQLLTESIQKHIVGTVVMVVR